jgi:rubrerythrin
MGSQYCEEVLPKEVVSKAQVQAAFRNLVDSARAEYGNRGYTGSFAEKGEVAILDLVFADADAASDYVREHADKRGCALAVRTLVLPRSDSAHARLARAPLETAREDRRQAETALQRLRAGAIARVKGLSAKTKGCQACGSAIAVAHLRSTHCPVCNAPDFLLTQGEKTRRDRLLAAIQEAGARAEAARIAARKPLERIPPGAQTAWIVGAWCPC